MTEMERKREGSRGLGRVGDRPEAETSPGPAKGAERNGRAGFRRCPAVGRESRGSNRTGREPSLADRATAGPRARYERNMRRKPLHSIRNPRWPNGAEGIADRSGWIPSYRPARAPRVVEPRLALPPRVPGRQGVELAAEGSEIRHRNAGSHAARRAGVDSEVGQTGNAPAPRYPGRRSSRIEDRAERKIRRRPMRQRGRPEFCWKRWSRRRHRERFEPFSQYRGRCLPVHTLSGRRAASTAG